MTARLGRAAEPLRRDPRPPRIVGALRDTALGYLRWLGAEVDSARAGHPRPPAAARHALIVVASLPPRFGAGVFRPLSWLRYGGEHGWRVSAVTRALTEPPTDAGLQLAAAIPDSIEIRHAPPLHLAPSHRMFTRIDGGLLTALELYLTGAGGFSHDPPAVVVGTGPSFNAFAAAYLLARRFGAKLVLDYRDEWTENPFPFVHLGNADRWWERRCLRAADAVLFTTAGQLHHNAAVFGRLIDGKASVLPNGWEPDPSVEAARPEARQEGTLDVAFLGHLGAMAMPGAFLADCATVFSARPDLARRVRLRFIGRRLQAADRELGAFPHPAALDLIDQVPRSEADRMMRQSGALLLMANRDMDRYMPGKMFEYIASLRPILVHGHPGEVSELVLRLGAGLYVPEGDAGELAAALDTLAATPRADWATPERMAWRDAHTRQRLARPFFDLLADLAGPG